MPKLAIVVGHNSKAQGAYSHSLGVSEFPFNSGVARQMVDRSADYGLDARMFLRRNAGSYSREIDDVYVSVEAWGPDAIVELHFNAGGGVGAEMLYAEGSTRGKLLAGAFQEAVIALGFKDRGVKSRSRSDRGGRSLFAASAPTIIAEPFFGDSDADTAIVERVGEAGLADAYLSAAARFLETGPQVVAPEVVQTLPGKPETGYAAAIKRLEDAETLVREARHILQGRKT